jgi:hypothetical protein
MKDGYNVKLMLHVGTTENMLISAIPTGLGNPSRLIPGSSCWVIFMRPYGDFSNNSFVRIYSALIQKEVGNV